MKLKLLLYSNSSCTAAEKQTRPLSTVKIHHQSHQAHQLRQIEPLCEMCRDSAIGRLVQLDKGAVEEREVLGVVYHLSSLCSLMALINRAQRYQVQMLERTKAARARKMLDVDRPRHQWPQQQQRIIEIDPGEKMQLRKKMNALVLLIYDSTPIYTWLMRSRVPLSSSFYLLSIASGVLGNLFFLIRVSEGLGNFPEIGSQ